MNQLIKRLRLPLACLSAALVVALTACSSSTAQAPPATQAELPSASEAMEFDAAATISLPESIVPMSESPFPVLAEEAAPQVPVQSAPAQQPATKQPFTRQAAIARGEAVLSGKRSVPCYNAEELIAFYEDYKAGNDASVSLYSFRTQADNEQLYTLYTLSLKDGATKMTEDTTHYYDANRFPEQTEEPGVSVLGTFTMTKNRYGFLILDVDGVNGLLQYHYQVTGYDELYPSLQKYAEESARYLAPLAGTGILEFSWEDPAQLLDAGVFPDAFEAIGGSALAEKRNSYWNEQKKTYCFPQDAVEAVVLPRFGFTADQLRALSAYDAESGTYNYVPRANSGLSDLRILKATVPEEGASVYIPGTDESLLEIRYEFYRPENGVPEQRGKLTVLLTADDDFRYLGHELLSSPVEEEAAE